MKGQLLLDTVRGMMNSQFNEDIERTRTVVKLHQRSKIGNDICDKVSGVSLTLKDVQSYLEQDDTS